MLLDSANPSVRLFKSIQDNEEKLHPHVWTDCRMFVIEISIPTNKPVYVKLQGIVRTRTNEAKFAKNLSEPATMQDSTNITESILSIKTLNDKSHYSEGEVINQESPNEYLIRNPETSTGPVIYGLQCDLKRNHWERKSKEKFMFFLLCITYDTYNAFVRVYAQHSLSSELASVETESKVTFTHSIDSKGEKRKIDDMFLALADPDLSIHSSLNEPQDVTLYTQTLQELETTVKGSSSLSSSPLRSEELLEDVLTLPPDLLSTWASFESLSSFLSESEGNPFELKLCQDEEIIQQSKRARMVESNDI